MTKYLLLPVLALLLLPLRTAFAETAAIGSVAEMEGSVTVQAGGTGPAAAATVNTPVHLQDVVATAANSKVRIQFVDATEITLAEKTRLKVDEYVFDPGAHAPPNKATYSVLEGAFQYLSGKITKTEKHDVKIQTAYGSIGIRGTKLWGGKIDGGYGIHVDEGRIVVHTAGGDVTLNAGEGTTLGGGTTPPTPPAGWANDKTHRAQLTILFGKKPKSREKHTYNSQDPHDLPSDDMGGPEPFVPEVGGGGGGSFSGGFER